MTRSGQVRSNGAGGSHPETSAAKVRYRLTGIDDPRWVFHAGWPGLGAPAGVRMARTDEKASAGFEGCEKVVTLIAPDGRGGNSQTGGSPNTRDGKPVWIRPRRGVRGGAPAAPDRLYSARPLGQNQADTAGCARLGR